MLVVIESQDLNLKNNYPEVLLSNTFRFPGIFSQKQLVNCIYTLTMSRTSVLEV